MCHDLHLYRLCQRCREENAKFRRGLPHDDRYCFEIFCKAILPDKSSLDKLDESKPLVNLSERRLEKLQAETEKERELAQTLIDKIYRPQVIAWVRAYRKGYISQEDLEDYVQDSWMRFYRYYKPGHIKDDTTLDSILTYLRMCVFHAIQPDDRPPLVNLFFDQDDEVWDIPDDSPKASKLIEYKEIRARLWALVEKHTLHSGKKQGQDEWLVIQATFVLGLKPREMVALYADKFQETKEIYDIKGRVYKRLRENMAFQELWREFLDFLRKDTA